LHTVGEGDLLLGHGQGREEGDERRETHLEAKARIGSVGQSSLSQANRFPGTTRSSNSPETERRDGDRIDTVGDRRGVVRKFRAVGTTAGLSADQPHLFHLLSKSCPQRHVYLRPN
jgi:hypothetical protein